MLTLVAAFEPLKTAVPFTKVRDRDEIVLFLNVQKLPATRPPALLGNEIFDRVMEPPKDVIL
jgi:hypothetical protein